VDGVMYRMEFSIPYSEISREVSESLGSWYDMERVRDAKLYYFVGAVTGVSVTTFTSLPED